MEIVKKKKSTALMLGLAGGALLSTANMVVAHAETTTTDTTAKSSSQKRSKTVAFVDETGKKLGEGTLVEQRTANADKSSTTEYTVENIPAGYKLANESDMAKYPDQLALVKGANATGTTAKFATALGTPPTTAGVTGTTKMVATGEGPTQANPTTTTDPTGGTAQNDKDNPNKQTTLSGIEKSRSDLNDQVKRASDDLIDAKKEDNKVYDNEESAKADLEAQTKAISDLLTKYESAKTAYDTAMKAYNEAPDDKKPAKPTEPEKPPITYHDVTVNLPKTDTDMQKATVTFVNDVTGKTITVKTLAGASNSKSGYTTTAKIKELEQDGYKLVTDPTNGQEITFDADSSQDQEFIVHMSKPNQKATVTYIDDTTGKKITVKKLSGEADSKSGYTTAETLKELKAKGYKLVKDGTRGKEIAFDDDLTKDQKFVVHLAHQTTKKTETNTATRTIRLHTPTGVKTIKQKATVKRTVTTDKVTGKKTYSKWTGKDWPEYKVADINGYKPSKSKVGEVKLNGKTKDKTVDVYYKASATGSGTSTIASGASGDSSASLPSTGNLKTEKSAIAGAGLLVSSMAAAGFVLRKKH